jgi:hypothetical protein
VGIADRVRALGGRLRIESRRGGAILAAEVPPPSDWITRVGRSSNAMRSGERPAPRPNAVSGATV